MNSLHRPNSVNKMAQQFQNMARLSQYKPDNPPPLPMSLPPEDDVIESHHHHHQQQQHQQGSWNTNRNFPQQRNPITQQFSAIYQPTQLKPMESSNSNGSAQAMADSGQTKLSGLARLADDLEKMAEDRETADIVFMVGANEVPIYAHRVILRARCQSFQNIKRGEICNIYGTTVSQTGNGINTSMIGWPQANADTLRDILFYVYTGKIRLQEGHVFEALAIGHELGLEELITVYEQHINSTIAIHNACEYMDAILCLKRRVNENDWNRIMQMCMQFISENAADCAKTPSFVNISKQGITHLVSSDYFSLDEADVFRLVLAWAKHQTGVMKHTQHWNEDERNRVSQQLSGVINHIRVLLIDSQVFAEEVEPTGVVPIELSLERYRFAALASSMQDQQQQIQRSQRKLMPTNEKKSTLNHSNRTSSLFADSKLLANDDGKEHILNAWYGVPKQKWKMIFRASSNDFSAEAFHDQCDGISPTFVLVLSTRGYLSGGFADVPWSRGDDKGRGKYVASDKAFLFTLHSSDDTSQTPMRYDIRKRAFAFSHHSNYGPIFGAGADLLIANRCHENDKSYSNLQHTYGEKNFTTNSLFGDYNFTVIDYEVFTIA